MHLLPTNFIFIFSYNLESINLYKEKFMVIDVIRYKLANGINEDFLKESASNILETWMKKQKGFIKWEINKLEDGYIDLVYWNSVDDIQLANTKMGEIPKDHNWFKCYDMSSVTAQKAELLFSSDK